MIQNGVVCYPGPALLLFIFRFEYLISGPKSYRDVRETGPRPAKIIWKKGCRPFKIILKRELTR